MKTIIILAVVVAFALGAPQAVDDSRNAQILRYETDNIGVDGYRYAFETSDGISRQEEAELKNVGTENEAISVRGSYSWVAPDGQTYTINFVADENGYQPEGAHLPKA
ncbi:flexible cuticle protein 12-like [Phlebotomus argentipes]|uniref:flexible cuticle protein 12-like n=1 Tax=Phlebotomus argentipes TaxID=94469 RepID=UPI00289360F6|nr:flexible cuticle protein 12-like [Phlebotomus argentipes]